MVSLGASSMWLEAAYGFCEHYSLSKIAHYTYKQSCSVRLPGGMCHWDCFRPIGEQAFHTLQSD